jgi:pimeloyl-ACP methyl ester carboxylesterase
VSEEPLPTSDPEPRTLPMPHGPLTYVDEGPRDAPALIAIHGVPGSVRDFRYLAPQLTSSLRVVRVDLPGFGGSAPVADAVATLGGRARVVMALADHLGLREFSVLGHSMGGGTALCVASRYPERVRLLVMVASMALSRHRGLGAPPWAIRAMAASLSVPGLRGLLVARCREAWRTRRFPGADSLDAADFAVQFRAIGAADFSFMRRAVGGRLPPAIVAYAEDDHMIETHISEELARALPRARVIAFAEGGHNLQKTRARELAAAILSEQGGATPHPLEPPPSRRE